MCIRQYLLNHWHQKSKPALPLLLLSRIYGLILSLRKKLYQKKLLKTLQLPIPVIVVGNITVGGTGKTPVVIYLAKYLQSEGFKPGIVTRGYHNRLKHYPYLVKENDLAKNVGDEALLLAKTTHVPVMIDPKRARAASTLFQKYHCDILLSDDGLSHYALGRTVEIALIANPTRYANTELLPAGPYREPIARLGEIPLQIAKEAGRAPFQLILKPTQLRKVNDPSQKKPLDAFLNLPIVAIAGIGDPENFFVTLKTLGYQFIEAPKPDHHSFSPKDFDPCQENIVIMTAKDAVKCQEFAPDNAWYLEVTPEITPSIGETLLKHLRSENG